MTHHFCQNFLSGYVNNVSIYLLQLQWKLKSNRKAFFNKTFYHSTKRSMYNSILSITKHYFTYFEVKFRIPCVRHKVYFLT